MATKRPSKSEADAGVVSGHSTLALALVSDGVISNSQLSRAERIQAILEEPLNVLQVLVEIGDVSDDDLARAVEKYGRTLHIGEVLVEQGVITAAVLKVALERQRESGEHLGAILIDMGQVNERILLRNVARQRGVPYIEPSFPMVATELLEHASADFLERHCFVPFSEDERGRVTVVVHDLDDTAVRKAVAGLFQDRADFALGPRESIEQTIDDYRRYGARAELKHAVERATDDSLIEQVNHIIQEAIADRASDIHIEPLADRTRLRYRIDGVLVFKTDLPKDLHAKLVSRVKVMAEIDIADHLHHQGGRVLFTHKGIEYDLRVSVYVTVHGENVVIRVLNKQIGLVSLQELGMSTGLQKRFKREVLDVPSGVVLITAPTGEGKTTTLYSCLDYSNDESIKIITAEDPVEYTLEGVVQCAIHEKAGRDFDSTLREIVRQDPDIVVLGEIRDKPTAQFAIEAALTGHKVYCTFHTEDSVAALLRLIEMEVEPFLISSTVRAVLAQRLLRRICAKCEIDDEPSLQDFEALGLNPSEMRQYRFRKGQGCGNCNFTGYRGRVAVFECLILNEGLRTAVFNRQPADVLKAIAFESTGIVNLREDAMMKAVRGMTTLAEVKRKTPIPHLMRPIEQILRMIG